MSDVLDRLLDMIFGLRLASFCSILGCNKIHTKKTCTSHASEDHTNEEIKMLENHNVLRGSRRVGNMIHDIEFAEKSIQTYIQNRFGNHS